jgi:protease I
MQSHVPAILIVIDEGFDDLEVMYPKLRLTEAGYHVFVAGKQRGKTYTGHYGYPCVADESIFSVQERHFAAVICPGGRAAETLRVEGKIKSLVHEFHVAGKLVAAICTGTWIPISAGIVYGSRVTGSPCVQDDLVNAGAKFEDAAVVTDGHLITARGVSDLPAFTKALLQALEEQQSNAKAAATHA